MGSAWADEVLAPTNQFTLWLRTMSIHCHVGTVIGNTYGLARGATAIAVKVLGSNGSGTTA